MSETFFATCPPGLEALLADELGALGAQAIEPTHGGVGFAGAYALCYAVNLESRLATRVLWRVAAAPYRREDDVYRMARDVDWPRIFDVGRSLRVDVAAIRSPLKSLDFITLRVKDAVCDRFRAEVGARPSVDTRSPDVHLQLFLAASDAVLYVDTSGTPLYRRGYKQAKVEAPLKENLAAGMLRLAGWDAREALLDPMCGSGTLLLEAAQIALDVAPGLGRGFAFERLRGFDAGAWAALRERALARRRASAPLPIFGSDLYGEQLQRARSNLQAAGLAEAVQLKQGNVLEIRAPAPAGVLVANPPYGERIGEAADLAQFYPRLGDALKKNFGGWRCYFLSADRTLPKLIGLRSSRRIPLQNGPLECRLYEYRMVEGELRGEPPPATKR